MRVAMPSPAGTNRAGLFINRPHAAYDAAVEKDAAAALSAFLQDELTPEEFAEFCRMAGIDAGAAMDDEGGGPGMPTNGIEKFGQDAMPRALRRARENAARIKVSV